MILILCLFGYILFIQHCSGVKSNQEAPEIEVKTDTTKRDTVWAFKETIKIQESKAIPEPKIVYVDRVKTETKIIYQDSATAAANIPPENVQTLHNYQDSLTDENITIFYDAFLEGRLIENNIRYSLKVPKTINNTITKTKTIRQPPKQISGLFITTQIGSKDFSGLDNISAGLQYVNKRGWSVGYEYDFLNQVHSAGIGVRVIGK